jgi:hypothetical protein
MIGMMMTTAAKSLNLRLSLVLLACAASYPVAAQTAAGLAQYTSGEVLLSKAGGASSALAKGGTIEAGDTITTGEQGRAQLRFSDGGFIALHANSKFSVNGYVDAKDGGKDQFLVSLVTGGMRAITGLIGKRNPSNYKVITPTASIGIRGSGFNVVHNANGTLSVSTELDAIDVCNQGGCIGLNVGESALVRNAQDRPVRTSVPATVSSPPVNDFKFAADNQTIPRPPAAPAQAFGVSGLQPDNVGFLRQYFDGALTLNANGQPIAFAAQGATGGGENTGVVSNIQSMGSAATNDQLILGTWSSGVWSDNVTSASAGNQSLRSLAFFTGQSTSSADLAGLSGRNATYTFNQATPVLSSVGLSGTVLPTSNLNVNFAGANTTVGVNLYVNFPTSASVASPGTDYALRGTANAVSTGFAGNMTVSGAACTTGCGSAAVAGAFIGPNAGSAGVTFAASTSQHGNFVGAAGFSRK